MEGNIIVFCCGGQLEVYNYEYQMRIITIGYNGHFRFYTVLFDGMLARRKAIRVSSDDGVGILVFQVLCRVFGPYDNVVRL